MNIAVVGTLDSKGHEHQFVADIIRAKGHNPILIDLGTGADPQVTPDITRFEIAEKAGLDLQPLLDQQDRGTCVSAMAEAAPSVIATMVADGEIDGIISLGGGGGTSLGTSVMRALPIGFPKLMVSTLASGNTAHYVGSSDITMMPSIVDVAGLNRVSKKIFTRAAGAICGMVETGESSEDSKPIIAASMFGNTTDCINKAAAILEDAGYEVLIFHATGTGGKTMESLIRSGMVKAVLDITTTEWADELLGATLSAGPTRMDAMTEAGIPAVIAPGCLDMANYGELESLPAEHKNRTIYVHNPQVTLLRTNASECTQLGKIIAQKANANSAPTSILIPTQAISIISAKDQSFYDPEADKALFSAIHENATVPVTDIDTEINSDIFAEACAKELLKLIDQA